RRRQVRPPRRRVPRPRAHGRPDPHRRLRNRIRSRGPAPRPTSPYHERWNRAMSDSRFKHVQYLWKDEEVVKMSPSERLVYRSNRLGDDLTLTNTGGGNTSAKVVEKDPMTGKDV